MMRKALVVGCLGLALAACKGGDKKEVGGNASGEILPGSVSDAMLPLDTVTSQAPLAPKAEATAKGDSAKPEKAAASPTSKPSEIPAEEPADPPAVEQ